MDGGRHLSITNGVLTAHKNKTHQTHVPFSHLRKYVATVKKLPFFFLLLLPRISCKTKQMCYSGRLLINGLYSKSFNRTHLFRKQHICFCHTCPVDHATSIICCHLGISNKVTVTTAIFYAKNDFMLHRAVSIFSIKTIVFVKRQIVHSHSLR